MLLHRGGGGGCRLATTATTFLVLWQAFVGVFYYHLCPIWCCLVIQILQLVFWFIIHLHLVSVYLYSRVHSTKLIIIKLLILFRPIDYDLDYNLHVSVVSIHSGTYYVYALCRGLLILIIYKDDSWEHVKLCQNHVILSWSHIKITIAVAFVDIKPHSSTTGIRCSHGGKTFGSTHNINCTQLLQN